jgi:hypothetical protein
LAIGNWQLATPDKHRAGSQLLVAADGLTATANNADEAEAAPFIVKTSRLASGN